MEELDSNDKLLCTLAYPIGFIIPIVLLLTKKENRTCRYHAFNALFAQIAVFLIAIALGTVFSILASFVPMFGCAAFLVVNALSLAFLIYMIVLALEVQKGNFPTIPFVTEFANKYIEG